MSETERSVSHADDAASFEEVCSALRSEREYQEIRWDQSVTDTGHKHSPCEWLVYINHQVQEALRLQSTIPTRKANAECLHILRKIGGLSVAAMQEHGAPLRDLQPLLDERKKQQ